MRQPFGVGDEKIVADKLYFAAEFARQHGPAVPVVFRQSVFDGNNRILRAPLRIKLDEIFGGVHRLVGFLENVFALLVVKLTGGDIERDGDIVAGLVSRRSQSPSK